MDLDTHNPTECRRCGRRRPSFDGAPQFARNGPFSPWLSIEFEFRTIFGVVYRKTLNPLSAGVSRNCLSGGTCVRAYSQSLTLFLALRVQRVYVCVHVCVAVAATAANASRIRASRRGFYKYAPARPTAADALHISYANTKTQLHSRSNTVARPSPHDPPDGNGRLACKLPSAAAYAFAQSTAQGGETTTCPPPPPPPPPTLLLLPVPLWDWCRRPSCRTAR